MRKRIDYDYRNLLNREDVYSKFRKRVRIGEKEFDSITLAAKYLKINPASLTNALKKGKHRGVPVNYIKK